MCKMQKEAIDFHGKLKYRILVGMYASYFHRRHSRLRRRCSYRNHENGIKKEI